MLSILVGLTCDDVRLMGTLFFRSMCGSFHGELYFSFQISHKLPADTVCTGNISHKLLRRCGSISSSGSAVVVNFEFDYRMIMSQNLF